MQLDLNKSDYRSVVAILQQHVPTCRVLVFGSRVHGKARTYSDLDLAIEGEQPLPSMQLLALKEAFSLSDLPICVDVVDLKQVDPTFKQHVEQTGLLLDLMGNSLPY